MSNPPSLTGATMKLNQLRIYKNKQLYANLPVGMGNRPEPHKCICVPLQTPTGVPWDVVRVMEDFVLGETGATRLREWSWEWQELPRNHKIPDRYRTRA
jgi:hypothetical protein